MEVRLVTVCTDCRVHWSTADETPACTVATHEHQRMEQHLHDDLVVLPDGTSVSGVSFDPSDAYNRSPDYGLYLDHHWQPPWPHDHLEWPDFGVPDGNTPLVAALDVLRAQTDAGRRAEIGCLGGHGRTGTALACLAVLTGQPAETAVAWVRAAYCRQAVETQEQQQFVAQFHR